MTQFSTDHYSVKGITFKDNQDYAISANKVTENYTDAAKLDVPFAVVSDGCSSAKNSDIGARIIGLITKQYLYFGMDDETMYRNMMIDAKQIIGQLGLTMECLTSTVLSVRQLEDKFDVTICGDGSVIIKQGKKLTAIQYVFETNAPYYLRYMVDDAANQIYQDPASQCLGNVKRNVFVWEDNTLANTSEIVPLSFIYKESFDIDSVDYIAVCTDGTESFNATISTSTSVTNQKISFETIIAEIFQFKNFNGNFLQRRMHKAFENFNTKEWKNSDDLSIAVIKRN